MPAQGVRGPQQKSTETGPLRSDRGSPGRGGGLLLWGAAHTLQTHTRKPASFVPQPGNVELDRIRHPADKSADMGPNLGENRLVFTPLFSSD